MTLLLNNRAKMAALVSALSCLTAVPFGALAQTMESPDLPARAEVIRTQPPPIDMRATRNEPEMPAPATFFVRVTGAGKEIWSGEMGIDNYQGADLRMTLQQGDGACGAQSEARFTRRQTGLTFSIRNAGRGANDPFAIGAEWTRPSADCALPGTRTSGIETAVTVAPGATRVIEGDGGLIIELTRRK